MKVLYLVSRGANDPTGASIGLHLAVNGSIANGDEVSVVFLGDGADLVRSGVGDAVQGVATPPLKDLLAGLKDNQVPVFV